MLVQHVRICGSGPSNYMLIKKYSLILWMNIMHTDPFNWWQTMNRNLISTNNIWSLQTEMMYMFIYILWDPITSGQSKCRWKHILMPGVKWSLDHLERSLVMASSKMHVNARCEQGFCIWGLKRRAAESAPEHREVGGLLPRHLSSVKGSSVEQNRCLQSS